MRKMITFFLVFVSLFVSLPAMANLGDLNHATPYAPMLDHEELLVIVRTDWRLLKHGDECGKRRVLAALRLAGATFEDVGLSERRFYRVGNRVEARGIVERLRRNHGGPLVTKRCIVG